MRRFQWGVVCGAFVLTACTPVLEEVEIGSRTTPVLMVNGLPFRDLNRNGTLDRYEDWRLSVEARADDLLARMTLAEKAGTMVHASLPGLDGELGGILNATQYDLDTIRGWVLERHITSAITFLATDAISLAEQNNTLQEIAEHGRLGIPLTISTNPRNHFQVQHGTSVRSVGFSLWPETTGFGAIGDADLVRRFAQIARSEYRATGLHMALSPMADLATEPRWGRINGTFGEDPHAVRALVEAYVEGFQGGRDGLTQDGVASVVKHWVGYGAAAEQGFDGHSPYGRYAAFPGGAFDQHIVPFEGAFQVNVAGVMPAYIIPRDLVHAGRAVEQVAAGFNPYLLTDLLRRRYGFDGVIVSDWGIMSDCPRECMEGVEPGEPWVIGTPWGMEEASVLERYVRGVEAGLDQIGGSHEPKILLEAVERGLLSEARLNASVKRILRDKFRQGLFENPFVNPAQAEAVLGNPETHAEALAAQRRSVVLLKNERGVLPLAQGTRKVFVHGIDPEAVRAKGFVVASDVADAELAIVRLESPREMLHPRHLFGLFMHEGNLAFAPGQEGFDLVAGLAARGIPVLASVTMTRPAVLTELLPHVDGLFADFGVSHEALLEVMLGQAEPEGRLPFELASSMAAVIAQKPDVPHDSDNPLFPIGFGLRYGED